ncbi:hypothetical protein K435DRAFT_656310 [Dendrothele bispora CBS 962.96]|uniref:HTH CENPB-type domain-containing protein n=1 Tax=Dendrothele bispora (strain CBS 962.96) TaxID=1314807 RepID=A0A4S8MFI1_DENBC|nr:hypothetical protein K435DRAFT_656310 [Dendrothele bispora CBS 962.96]
MDKSPETKSKGGRPRSTKLQHEKETQITRKNAFQNAKQHLQEGDTYYEAAQHKGVPKTSSWHRDHGRKSRAEAHAGQKKLSDAEEEEIRDWLWELDSWGAHLRHQAITACAEDIMVARGDDRGLGKTWIRKFMCCLPELQTRLAETHNPPYNIKPQNLWNPDEKGYMLGTAWRDNVVMFRRDWENEDCQSTGRATLITVLDCISTDGVVLPPYIIMKGQRPSFAWVKDSRIDKGFIAASPNGWINNKLAVLWLQHCFEPLTRPDHEQEWCANTLENQYRRFFAIYY